MKISLEWLKDYIKLDLSPSQLVEKLRMIGLSVREWEEKGEDILFDIETHASRPDTLGHLGIARELAAGLRLPLEEQSWPLTELEQKTSNLMDVQIWEEDLCPRYTGIIIKNVQVGPSPDWLKKRIEAMGLKPTNNVVDVTNCVLFSTAQPVHAFDLAKIKGRKIIIRKANKGERFQSLEGKDVKLTPEMLVIADELRPLALAGIIGGSEAAVQESTQDVFVESACFNPLSIRITSKQTGIATEASYRFERGTDISFLPRAALVAASLLTQLRGSATKGIVDVYPRPRRNKTIVLRSSRINDLLGVKVDEKFTQDTLSRLGYHLDVQQPGVWQVKVPHFRIDVDREADLIEDIARFYGYDNIPLCVPPIRISEPHLSQKRKKINRLRQLLFHYGFDEVVNYSFSNPEKESSFQTGRKKIGIRNPISSKASILRTTLIGGSLENIVWNRNRGAEGVHIFEIGNIYFWEERSACEQLTLSLATTGSLGGGHWQRKDERANFFHVKGACESLMTYLRYEPFSFVKKDHAYFQKSSSLALVYKGETIGYLGLLKGELLDAYSLEEEVWAAELNLEALFGKQPMAFRYAPVVKFPSVSRDVSFILDRRISFQDIKEEVEKISIPCLERFDLYDRFSGGSIPKDKISLSLRFIYRHPLRTLQAEEVNSFQQKIIDSLRGSFSLQLREGGKIDKRIRKN